MRRRIRPRFIPEPRQKGDIWPRVHGNRGRKGSLWPRVTTEAKGYPPLASPQYASVREPVQNMKNNRYQKAFLHWCFNLYL